MKEQLTPADAAYLELEQADECSHMHIGWAMIFDPRLGGGSPAVAEVRDLLESRLDAMPRFRCRLSHQRAGGLRWPRWEQDSRFDVAAHVRHATLPSPGGERELLDWLADFYSHRLDRSRPLWEMTLVDGLAGGSWCIATKVHHCLVDGMSGVSVTNLLLDSSPTPSRGETPASGAPQASSHHLPGMAMLARGARAGVNVALHPQSLSELLQRAGQLAEFIVRDELVPAPPSSLNVPIGGHRRMEMLAVPLSDLKAVKAQLGGSVNDVVLAIAAGGLRHLLEARGETLPDQGLRVMVPVNLRRASEMMSLGNRVSSLFVELPVSEPDPVMRYRKTAAATAELKRSGIAAGAETLMEIAGLVPPILHSALAKRAFTPRLFNVTITNVPGPQQTLYALGTPLRRVIPLVPIFADHAVGLAVVSYDGEVVFGLNGDHGAMPDLSALTAGLEQSLAELQAFAGLPAGEFTRPPQVPSAV
ncbi:MAG TPA: wax ester/triacylglycerol synthase family O-acyltransferase [Solirubrobacterales bacterium]|nr:wax ester/triacylglycerol synthase family O-acyltransferase [Solirubrobacterales bacterium]